MSFATLSPRFHAFSLLALPLAVAALSACSKEAPAAGADQGPPPPLPVHVLAAKLADVPETVEVIGSAEGAREVEVRARVQGIVQKRVFEEGQAVKAGAVLFEIERAPYEIALNQAKAQLAQADAQLAQAKADGVRTASALAQAVRDDDRMRKLVAEKVVSQREADSAQAQREAAEAAIQGSAAAEAAARAAQLGANANIRAAELNLSYCAVTAPVDGITGRAAKSEGALVTPADGLLTTLVQTDPIWVRFSFSNADLARIHGDPATAIEKVSVSLPSGEAYAQPGKINFSASMVDPKLDTLTLRAEFPNPERAILPGQFLRVKAQVGVKKGVFLLPQEAVLTLPQIGQAVFVMAPDASGKRVAQMRKVKAGAWSGAQWIIEPGEGTALKPGDLVITDQIMKIGFSMKMGGGQPVEVVDAAIPAPAGAPEVGQEARDEAQSKEGGAK